MTPTTHQQQDFVKNVIPSNLLDEVVIWVGNNMSPDQVFPRTVLEEWCIDMGYKKDET